MGMANRDNADTGRRAGGMISGDRRAVQATWTGSGGDVLAAFDVAAATGGGADVYGIIACCVLA